MLFVAARCQEWCGQQLIVKETMSCVVLRWNQLIVKDTISCATLRVKNALVHRVFHGFAKDAKHIANMCA